MAIPGGQGSWMLKFIEKTAPWCGEAGKEVKGAQAAGVELRGLLCMNTGRV